MVQVETCVVDFAADALAGVAGDSLDVVSAAQFAGDVHVLLHRAPAVDEQDLVPTDDLEELLGGQRGFEQELAGVGRVDGGTHLADALGDGVLLLEAGLENLDDVALLGEDLGSDGAVLAQELVEAVGRMIRADPADVRQARDRVTRRAVHLDDLGVVGEVLVHVAAEVLDLGAELGQRLCDELHDVDAAIGVGAEIALNRPRTAGGVEVAVAQRQVVRRLADTLDLLAVEADRVEGDALLVRGELVPDDQTRGGLRNGDDARVTDLAGGGVERGAFAQAQGVAAGVKLDLQGGGPIGRRVGAGSARRQRKYQGRHNDEGPEPRSTYCSHLCHSLGHRTSART